MKPYLHQIFLAHDAREFDKKDLYEIKISSLINTLDAEHRMWYEDDIVELIKNNFDNDVLLAFNTLKSNAFRADIARYCILYKYGGWYADLMFSANPNFKIDSSKYELIIFKDMAVYSKLPMSVYNGFIMVKDPGHPAIKSAIDRSVKNVLSKRYPRESHLISGPPVLGLSIAEYILDNPKARILYGNESYILEDIKKPVAFLQSEKSGISLVAYHKHPDEVHTFAWPDGYQSSYGNLFFDRQLYKD